MSRLVWLAVGFVLGVSIARNSAAMPHPVAGAVLLGTLLACGVSWFAGRRGLASAVASAVAVADARADATAAAVAHGGSVNVYTGTGAPLDERSPLVFERWSSLHGVEVVDGESVGWLDGAGAEGGARPLPVLPSADGQAS